jgi:hypothetical protein
MSTMEQEVYEAFRALGAAEDKALKAATALSRRDTDVAELKRDVALLKWGQGVTIAMLIAVLLRLFLH